MAQFVLCNKYYLEDELITRKCVGYVALMNEKRNTYSFDGKSNRKEPLGRPMRRWEDNANKRNRMTGCGLNSSGSG
jgi:hypothetical protein